jgi:helicase
VPVIVSAADLSDNSIKALLRELGYDTLYPPQEMAVSSGILEGKNMMVTTPTASGKTLVAMMAIVKTLERGRKAAYMTPLRALASEKYDDLKVLEAMTFGGKRPRVIVATGDYDSSGKELASADVIVLTNEKMDTLFRHGAEWLADIGLFVSDEIHLIGERERGPTLEMMLTKIRRQYPTAQIVALSATVANSDELAGWLGCRLVESAWRPTKLVEGVYEHGRIKLNDGKRIQFVGSGLQGMAAVDLAIDSLTDGGQALIFGETRKRASSLAAKAAEGVYKRLDKSSRDEAARISAMILDRGEDSEITRTLSQLVSKGVAFHHAGLGPSSRSIVEDAFKNGTIKVLAATPTLAAGVNLPARRVVIASIMRYDSEYGGSVPISVLDYKQLCGRAGRPKYDTFGEAIITAGDSGASGDDLYDHYVLGNPEPIRSQMSSERAIRFHLLATIASVPGLKRQEICDLFSATLYAQQSRSTAISFKLESAMEYLEQQDLIKSRNDRFIATEFGRRTSLLYIDPVTAVEFRDSLTKIERKQGRHTLGFLYLITNSPDFYPKLSLRKKDYEDVILMLQEGRGELLYEITEYDCSRSMWALSEWLSETADRELGERLGVEPGDMHRIVEVSEWLAYSLYEVAKIMRREDFLPELYNLRVRIRYGVKEELLPLVALEGIGRVRARALHTAGLTDVASIAKSPQAKLAAISKIGPSVAKKLKEQLEKRRSE